MARRHCERQRRDLVSVKMSAVSRVAPRRASDREAFRDVWATEGASTVSA